MATTKKEIIDNRYIGSREELYDLLEIQMMNVYTDILEKQRLDFENRFVKSYLLEVDSYGRRALEGNPKTALEELFATDRRGYSIMPLKKDEEGFYEVLLSNRGHVAARIFIDTVSDERFWITHSLSVSKVLDSWFGQVLAKNSNLDHFWLWPGYLEELQSLGIPRGFGLSYDFRKFSEDVETATHLSMQLWGDKQSQELYRTLKNSSAFGDKVVLSRVKVKLPFEPDNYDSFAIEEIKFNGKFVAHGNSFAAHIGLLNQVRRQYKSIVQGIEDQYRMRWTETERQGLVLEGYAIHFVPVSALLDVERFVDIVFDGSPPFGLFGIRSQRHGNAILLRAVDTHTGSILNCEIWPDVISIYLPQDSCGNTIARFYTNLQHFYSANFTVEVDNGDKLFQPATAKSASGIDERGI